MHRKGVCVLLEEQNVGNQGIQKNYYLSIFCLTNPWNRVFFYLRPLNKMCAWLCPSPMAQTVLTIVILC